MERDYQENRSYLAGANCSVSIPTDDHFTYTCAGTQLTFLWTATSKVNAGLGSSSGGYIYTIDQNGDTRTTAYEGNVYGPAKTCWLIKKTDC